MNADFSFLIWNTRIAHFQSFPVKDFSQWVPRCEGLLYGTFFPTLVATFLLKGGLYHVTFLLLVLPSLRIWSLLQLVFVAAFF